MCQIDYFFSVLSPFAYLAGDRLEAIAARRNASIRYAPLDIMELFSRTGGVPPGQRHESRIAYRLQDLSRVASFNDMKINLAPRHWPTDPVPASVAIIRARSGEGDIGLLVQKILTACWLEERDIAVPEVIGTCLEASGFGQQTNGMSVDEAQEVYSQNTEEAVSRNVFGSPSYVVGDQVFWGQDRLAHLDRFLEARSR